jgi:hypothetical protein
VGDDVATVTVERTRTPPGLIRRLKVVIDGRSAGSLRFGETKTCPVDEGEHTVMTKMDWFKSPVVQVNPVAGADVHLVADLPRPGRFSGVRTLFGKRVISLTIAPRK